MPMSIADCLCRAQSARRALCKTILLPKIQYLLLLYQMNEPFFTQQQGRIHSVKNLDNALFAMLTVHALCIHAVHMHDHGGHMCACFMLAGLFNSGSRLALRDAKRRCEPGCELRARACLAAARRQTAARGISRPPAHKQASHRDRFEQLHKTSTVFKHL